MSTPNYIEVLFNNLDEEQCEIVIALLSDYGFNGFEEKEVQLKAFINEAEFDTITFQELMAPYKLDYKIHTIVSQNWNAVWESNFEPVVVGNFVGIRAHFHPPFTIPVLHEVIITPKMSFGTGHHATTYMMIEQMQQLNFENKQVLDFGTGTGILAIISEKLGAAQVLAIDIDEWSIENAKENITRNDCHRINLQQANAVPTNTKFDVLLANINKNVILQNIKQLADVLSAGGYLLLSGLLIEDELEMIVAANACNLTYRNTICKQQWTCMLFAR